MTISREKKALLHVAKTKLALDDDTYRRILAKIAGVTTSNDLEDAGFTAVMGFLKEAGFDPVKPEGQNYGRRRGMATPAQVELVRVLWRELHHAVELDEQHLNAWMLKWWKVSSLRFLTADQAPKVIGALKMMKSRGSRAA